MYDVVPLRVYHRSTGSPHCVVGGTGNVYRFRRGGDWDPQVPMQLTKRVLVGAIHKPP
jgi:hypothetical protein